VTSSSGQTNHDDIFSDSAWCSTPGYPSHFHTLSASTGEDAHVHGWSVGFASASLSSPWYNHVHALTGSPCAYGGVTHTHTATCNGGKCTKSGDSRTHSHTVSGGPGTVGNSHYHTYSGNSDYTNSGQTPQSHSHTFTLTLDPGGEHQHGWNLYSQLANNTCYLGNNHGHGFSQNCPNGFDGSGMNHNHTASGTSGMDGESPSSSGPNLVGDGLTWIVA
jgi:hypothetical protein